MGGLGGPCGIVGYDELGRDVVAKTFHKQFVDRCWRSSTATRTAAAKDLSQAPGTTATGSNSAWEQPFSSDSTSSST